MPLLIKKWHFYMSHILCIGLALLSGVTYAQPSYIERPPFEYRVQKEDTLSLIVARYLIGNETIAELKVANPSLDFSNLIAGQLVLLPRQLIRYRPATAVGLTSNAMSPSPFAPLMLCCASVRSLDKMMSFKFLPSVS